MLFLSHYPPFDSFYIFHLCKGQLSFFGGIGVIGGMGNMGGMASKKSICLRHILLF